MPTVALTEPQLEFVESENSYVAAVAGFGSGKTQSAITKIVKNKFKYPSIDQAYLAPTYGLISTIFYPRISSLLGEMRIPFRVNRSINEVHIQGHGRIICRTMENPDMIIGWECGDATMDEFDLLTIEKAFRAMEKVSARCRQKFPDGKKNQKLITTTPEGFKATYKMFKKEPFEDSKLITMSTESNRHNLPDGYIEGLRAQYPDQLIDAYLDGMFVNLTSGTVYYSFNRKLHDTKYIANPKEALHIGMDFNVYKMSSIVHVIRDNKAYAVDEILDLRDTPDMIEAIKEKYERNPVFVYPDSSGKSTSSKGASLSDINLLKEAKFQLRYRSTNPRIKDRVTSMNAAFEKGNYFVNVDRCPFYSECLEQQSYDKTGQPEKDGVLDNPLDAGGYFIFYKFPVVRHGIVESNIGGM